MHQTCTAPCREGGVVRTGARSVTHAGKNALVQAELVGTGCGSFEPPKTQRSPAGAPCSHYSVCTAARCRCEGSANGHFSRACVEGRCAEAELACTLAPRVVRYDACRARPVD
jgi:hypothetical protein